METLWTKLVWTRLTQCRLAQAIKKWEGGVYRVEKSTSTQKTPFLGDLPFIGYLFKRTISSDEKSELLIFITPRLVEEGLVSN